MTPAQMLCHSIEKFIAKSKRQKKEAVYVSTGGGTKDDIISYRQQKDVHFKVGQGPQVNKSVDFAKGLAGNANAELLQRYIEVKRVQERSVERQAANGNYVANAFGPERIGRPRYINESIELELIEFKIEIEEKFTKSKMNHNFRFPLIEPEKKLFVEVKKPHALRYSMPDDSFSDTDGSLSNVPINSAS